MKSLYTKLGIRYQQAYSGPYQDLSMSSGKSLLVIGQKEGKLSGFGRPSICLGDPEELLKMFKKLYEQFHNVWYMDFSGVDKISRFLLSEGHVPSLFYTQVIDLTKTVPQLHSEMRKSYQNLCNKYTPIVSVSRYDIDEFKKLHKEVVGFQTRSDETWEIQKAMLENKEAFIVHSPSWDSAGLFIYDKDSCYYGVGKSLPQAVSHPLLWKAICQAKRLGCKEFEMGQQVFSGDPKDVNISMFKRGFGGTTKVRLEFKCAY